MAEHDSGTPFAGLQVGGQIQIALEPGALAVELYDSLFHWSFSIARRFRASSMGVIFRA
jgi:hypothetical protein